MSKKLDTSSEATVTSKYYVVLSDSEGNNKVVDLTLEYNKIIDLTSDDEETECAVENKAAVSSVGKGKVDINFAQGKEKMNVNSSKTMRRKLNGLLTNKKKRLQIPDCDNPSFQQCSSQSSSSPHKIRRQKLT
ncbi:uncharacterized protein [Primulina huaijiensis]|uniref:uncharacterized protein n=1 Tax=Primulina huaijiensis TaxID=1492673 RepID=UPI003CC774F3